jgi:hypothetical protein
LHEGRPIFQPQYGGSELRNATQLLALFGGWIEDEGYRQAYMEKSQKVEMERSGNFHGSIDGLCLVLDGQSIDGDFWGN